MIDVGVHFSNDSCHLIAVINHISIHEMQVNKQELYRITAWLDNLKAKCDEAIRFFFDELIFKQGQFHSHDIAYFLKNYDRVYLVNHRKLYLILDIYQRYIRYDCEVFNKTKISYFLAMAKSILHHKYVKQYNCYIEDIEPF